jgi:zinc protease
MSHEFTTFADKEIIHFLVFQSNMIQFDRFILPNGLRVIVHQDVSTPMVAMNILYDVGARDENPDKTGFAHLFEHLMFGGSVNIPNYDGPLQQAGGDNNAFTNSDITNYYLTIPKNNLETAFWLESDRMLNLAFSEKSFEVQRHVVIEEFNQSYLNQPYGDVWLLLKPLAYKEHPYQWNTIGKETSHISDATLDDVKAFYTKFYNPDNAILTLAGNITTQEVKDLATKWFGPIDKQTLYKRNLPAEPVQTEARTLTVYRNVPTDAIYKAWHCGSRADSSYYASDLLSDMLGSGQSSILHLELVKKQSLFSDLDAYITGDQDPGLFIISGKLMPGVSAENADLALQKVIERFCEKGVSKAAIEKVKNRVESTLAFSNISLSNRALELSICEHLGDANLINQLPGMYEKVGRIEIRDLARQLFRNENCSTLFYLSETGNQNQTNQNA